MNSFTLSYIKELFQFSETAIFGTPPNCCWCTFNVFRIIQIDLGIEDKASK